MKAGIPVVVVLLICSGSVHAELSYKLSEAIQKNLVKVKMNGAKADTSFHGP